MCLLDGFEAGDSVSLEMRPSFCSVQASIGLVTSTHILKMFILYSDLDVNHIKNSLKKTTQNIFGQIFEAPSGWQMKLIYIKPTNLFF